MLSIYSSPLFSLNSKLDYSQSLENAEYDEIDGLYYLNQLCGQIHRLI